MLRRPPTHRHTTTSCGSATPALTERFHGISHFAATPRASLRITAQHRTAHARTRTSTRTRTRTHTRTLAHTHTHTHMHAQTHTHTHSTAKHSTAQHDTAQDQQVRTQDRNAPSHHKATANARPLHQHSSGKLTNFRLPSTFCRRRLPTRAPRR